MTTLDWTTEVNPFRVTLRNRGTARAYVIVTIDERYVPVETDAEGNETLDWGNASYPSAERVARVVGRIVGRLVHENEIGECSGGEDGEAVYPLRLGEGIGVELCEDEDAFGDIGDEDIDAVREEYKALVEERVFAEFGPFAEVDYGGKVEVCANNWRQEETLKRLVRDAWDEFCRG